MCVDQTTCCSTDRVQVHPDGVSIHAYYSLGQPVGEGGYGIVRRSRERRSGVVRACKTTAKIDGVAGMLCARMEVDILRAVQKGDRGGGCIVRLYEVFEDGEAVHIVMELCGGGELYQRQAEVGLFPEPEAKILLWQMFSAMGHVHRHDVVHRDLKLENWLLTRPAPNLDLRLCDFGLSIFIRPGEVATDCVGSVYYVAPEVLNGAYDQRADVWSLGVIMFMLLSGLPPFNGPNQAQILDSIKHGWLSFDAPIWRTVCPDARALILRLLQMNPNTRIDTEQALSDSWMEGAISKGIFEPVLSR